MGFFEGFFSGNKEEEKSVATENMEEGGDLYKELMTLEDQIEKAKSDPEFAQTIDVTFIQQKINNIKAQLNLE